MAPYDEEEIITRAFRAYFTRARRAGHVAMYPANSSYVDETSGRVHVILENINGVLAVYRLKDNGHIEFVREEYWPRWLVEAEAWRA